MWHLKNFKREELASVLWFLCMIALAITWFTWDTCCCQLSALDLGQRYRWQMMATRKTSGSSGLSKYLKISLDHMLDAGYGRIMCFARTRNLLYFYTCPHYPTPLHSPAMAHHLHHHCLLSGWWHLATQALLAAGGRDWNLFRNRFWNSLIKNIKEY